MISFERKKAPISEDSKISSQTNQNEISDEFTFNVKEISSSSSDESSGIQKVISLSYHPSLSKLFFIPFSTLASYITPKFLLNSVYEKSPLTKSKFIFVLGSNGKDFQILPFKKRCVLINNLENQPEEKDVYYFTYKFKDYIFDEESNSFFSLHDYITAKRKTMIEFLSDDIVAHLQSLQGENIIIKENISFVNLLTSEVKNNIFYILVFLLLFSFSSFIPNDLGVFFAFVNLFSMVISIIGNRILFSEFNKNLEKDEITVNVYRKDEKGAIYHKIIPSTELVYGDIYDIPKENFNIPTDTLILNGNVIIKTIKGETLLKISNDVINRGDRVINKRNIDNKQIGKVIGVSYNCQKGDMIRKFYYEYKNYPMEKQCFELLTISSLIIGTLYISLCFYFVSGSFNIIKLSGLVLVLFFSFNKLYNLAYKRNCYKILFEQKSNKTEQNKLPEIHSYHPVKLGAQYQFNSAVKSINKISESVYNYYKEKRFDESNKNKEKELEEFFLECIATCHYVTSVNKKLISNDLNELSIFKDTKWDIYEPTGTDEIRCNYDTLISTYVKHPFEKDLQEKLDEQQNYANTKTKGHKTEEDILKEHYELGVVRRFNKDKGNNIMTVLVKDVNDQFYKIYSKGTADSIKKVCKSDTIPSDYDEVVNEYKEKGLEVIALSSKMMKMNYMQSQKIERSSVEKNMIFLGFVVMGKVKGSQKEEFL